LEVWKHSIRVATDRWARQEEALRDLAVRQSFGGELSDLQLLRRQAITEIRRTPADPLPACPQLLARAPAPGGCTKGIEERHAFPQRRPRFGTAPLPPQPATKREQCPGSKERTAGQVLSQRRGEQRLRLIVRRQSPPGACQVEAEERPPRMSGGCCRSLADSGTA